MALLPQRGDTGITLSGFLILAALGTFLWKGAPLESGRPSNETSGLYEHQFAQKIPARLWQDPFKAVYEHEKAIREGDVPDDYGSESLSYLSKKIRSVNEDLSLLMVMVSPGSYAELEERRRRRRYAVLAGLSEEHFVPRDPEHLNVAYLPTDWSSISESNCTADTKSNTKNSSTETRQATRDCYPVPFEWYENENIESESAKPHHVLVLWLDESKFADSPLKRVKEFLKRLLDGNKPDKISLRAVLLGPGRSDALRNLATKNEKNSFCWLQKQSQLTEFSIISSTATVPDAALTGKWSPKVVAKESVDSAILKRYPDFAGNSCTVTRAAPGSGPFLSEKDSCEKNSSKKTSMRFLRTIRNDEDLIIELVEELKHNRGIKLKDNSINDDSDYVVVISEWDTFYGRFLPRAFKKHFCAPEADCEKVLRYSYQRGVDGLVVSKQDKSNQSQRSNPSPSKGNLVSPLIDATAVRRPTGTGQYDYLRRLAVEIRDKDREKRLSEGHGVGIVVLLGSDVYDKLLILRALRPELPGALFATTDLDAQLLHPAEYRWTRNLIVASTYGLKLSEQVPMAITTMPFRDSYQTSIYLATRLAFNSSLLKSVGNECDGARSRKNGSLQKCTYDKIPPQLFEIGRQRLVTLPEKLDKPSTYWNRRTVKSFALPISLGLGWIAVLGIFAIHQLRPGSDRVVAVLGVLLFVFSLLTVVMFLQEENGEPMNLLAGVSIWPSEYIRSFGLALSLIFIWSVVHRLRGNWIELGDQYFEKRHFRENQKPDDERLTLKKLWQDLTERLRHPIGQLKQITKGQYLIAFMIAVMLLSMMFLLPMSKPLNEKIWLLIIFWSGLILFWWATLYGWIWRGVHVLSVNKWAKTCAMNSNAVRMWLVYGEYGSGEQRFLRTVAYVLLYLAFASFLFSILGMPTSPCRGNTACVLDKAILGLSVLSMLILLCLVVDAARLCICWVDSMRTNMDWSNSQIEKLVRQLRLPESHAVAWIKIHLIGERTSEVTRLIYYPVLVILLLLLARSTYFDNWDFPQALSIIIGLNFVIALTSVVRLNHVARSVREKILRDLQYEKLAAGREHEKTYVPSPSERQELIQQLENLRIGAFLRVWDQPPVRATLMLLGGTALTYAQYLTVLLD